MLSAFHIINKIKNSRLFHDSIWAVFGSGLGNALLLLSGIIIARILGKDVYGEYGVVKTNMLYIAGFATLGLGTTSTRFIAKYIDEDRDVVGCVIRDSLVVCGSFSFILCISIFMLSKQISDYMGDSLLTTPFRFLSFLIFVKSVCMTQIGILSGFKEFKSIGINGILSSISMLFLCIPLTYLLGIKGALLCLSLSQVIYCILNQILISKHSTLLPRKQDVNLKSTLVKFSLPIAMQESSFALCNWIGIMLLTKLSSVGEVGLYTAAAQWNALILMVPVLLTNVVLSYLSGNVSNINNHNKTVILMVCINFICSVLPLTIVVIASPIICSLYGDSFRNLSIVLNVLILSTVFESCSQVLKSEFIAQGRTWILFLIRLLRDIILALLIYILLSRYSGENGALYYSVSVVVSSIFFFVTLILFYVCGRSRSIAHL